MGTFVPPAAQALIAPSSPAAGVVIGSREQVDPTSALVLVGAQILAGSRFTDTLGGFYPFQVKPSKSLVINGSDSNLFGIRFHNTAVSSVDAVIAYANSAVLFVIPNQATSIGNTALFVVADRVAALYAGIVFYPGYAGGPLISWADGAGGNVTWFAAGVFYGVASTNASTTATAGLKAPHGSAPTTPVNGDIWTTTAGMFVRVNGTTKSVTLT